MNGWKTPIRCYVSPAGNNKIADWYARLSVREKADADEFLKNMRKTSEWNMPEYRHRLVNAKGIGELRWRSENKQHRLLGFHLQWSDAHISNSLCPIGFSSDSGEVQN